MSDAVKRVFFGKGSDSLQVEGQDDLLVYRARCCNPIRGEEIIGYVTRGKGVAVHARACPNVQNLLYESDRRIQVEWGAEKGTGDSKQQKPTTYPVKLTVLCDDRSGLLKEFTAIISDDGTNIRSVGTTPTPDGSVVVDFVIEKSELGVIPSAILEMPKSRSFTQSVPSGRIVRKRFPGFRSRWIVPIACASASASQAWSR